MPGGDRTGPLGMGPLTGRAAGYCAGYGVPGCANPLPGRGFGSGFGRGRGFWGRGFGGGVGRGRGFIGREFGGGRGRRNMFYATGLPGWMRYGGYGAPYGYAATQGYATPYGYTAPYGYPLPYAYQGPLGRPDPQLEKQTLQGQAEALQAELDLIKKRLDELESGPVDE